VFVHLASHGLTKLMLQMQHISLRNVQMPVFATEPLETVNASRDLPEMLVSEVSCTPATVEYDVFCSKYYVCTFTQPLHL
jgi:hypothetical protein